MRSEVADRERGESHGRAAAGPNEGTHVLKLLGIRIPPILGVPLGVLLGAMGVLVGRPLLCIVGVVVVVMSVGGGLSDPATRDPRSGDDSR